MDEECTMVTIKSHHDSLLRVTLAETDAERAEQLTIVQKGLGDEVAIKGKRIACV